MFHSPSSDELKWSTLDCESTTPDDRLPPGQRFPPAPLVGRINWQPSQQTEAGKQEEKEQHTELKERKEDMVGIEDNWHN